MNNRKQRLELTWIGKDERPRLEPRILLEDADKSYHSKTRVTNHDIFDNILVHGDNLLALKALEHEYAGKVKCVFIDPPYNTGSAFEHYQDGIEHSAWLSLMRDRLELIKRIISEDGSVWIMADDNEGHYLKVLCDEIFGRQNFVSTIIWQKLHARNNTAQHFSADHDFILVFARDLTKWKRNKVSRTDASDADFWNPDADPRGDWRRSDLTASKPYNDGKYEVVGPHGGVFGPRKNRWWSLSRASFDELVSDNRIWWGKKGQTFPFRKRFRSELGELVPTTVWPHEDVGNNREAKQEVTKIFGRDDMFSTPKPERLLARAIRIATNPGDLVLDSFAGSGTTGAVAQKMGRRWIMVELGEHCGTHIVPRLKRVIDGTDEGGITDAVAWKGGGGFRYYRLAPSLLEKDAWGNWVITREFYDPAKLSQAVCKLMAFFYQPDETRYWMQGRSSETDFIYVTTQSLTHEQLAAIAEEVGDERTLLVCCKAFRANADAFPNLTIKKIPQAVLRKCEWGHDDYSLHVAALPEASPVVEASDNSTPSVKSPKSRIDGDSTLQDDFFGQGDGK